MPAHPHPSNPAGAAPPPSLLTFDDLVADLVWPKLLGATKLALRPARLGLAFVYLVGAFLVLSLAEAAARIGRGEGATGGAFWERAVGGKLAAAGEFGGAVAGLRAGPAAAALYELFVGLPAALVAEHPILMPVVTVVLLVWTVLFGGAIARSAATEFALGMSLAWPQALGFAAGRLRSMIGAVVLPLVLVWAIGLGLAVAGWALFSLPVLDVIGGVLWALFLLAGLAAAVAMIGYVLAHAMLVPAVVCEGTDAVDAAQHAYSYALSKPLRLLWYALVLLVQGLLAGFVVLLVVALLVLFARLTAGAWTGPGADAAIAGATAAPGGELPATKAFAARLVRLWTAVPVTLGVAFFVSYFWSGAALLYLAMRRACDGQDVHELWVPGMVEGTMAESIRGRAAAATGAAGEAVIDDGPADET